DRDRAFAYWHEYLTGQGHPSEASVEAANAAAAAEVKGMSKAQAADVALSVVRGNRKVRIGLPLWQRLLMDQAVIAFLLGLLLVASSFAVFFPLGTTFLAVFTIVLAIRGWGSPTKLSFGAIVLVLIAMATFAVPGRFVPAHP